MFLRLALAGLLGWAGVLKLMDPASFAESIANYRLLPELAVGPLALGLPVLEIVVAVALLVGPQVQGAAVVSAVMFSVFATAMAQAAIRGIDLECGCFGASGGSEVSWTLVIRNLLLSLGALWVGLSPVTRWREVSRPSSEATEAVD